MCHIFLYIISNPYFLVACIPCIYHDIQNKDVSRYTIFGEPLISRYIPSSYQPLIPSYSHTTRTVEPRRVASLNEIMVVCSSSFSLWIGWFHSLLVYHYVNYIPITLSHHVLCSPNHFSLFPNICFAEINSWRTHDMISHGNNHILDSNPIFSMFICP